MKYLICYNDYLGNVRLSYAQDGTDLVIREENNYYPFGLKHKGYNNVITAGVRDHKYGFGGKEEQGEFGLEWHDFHARNYDPALGRWMNIDPLAEKYLPITPYSYAANSPLYYLDPDGKEIRIYYGSGNNIRSTEYTYKENRNYKKITDPFLRDTFKALDALYVASEIEVDGEKVNIMSEVIKSSKVLSIDEASEGIGTNYQKTQGVNTFRSNGQSKYKTDFNNLGTIHFNRKLGVLFDDVNDPDTEKKLLETINSQKINSPASILGHDISHAFNWLKKKKTDTGNSYQDRLNNKMYRQNGFIFENQEEARATTMSSQINLNLNENQRLNHRGALIKTDGVLSNKKS